jgi:hypothetical protein
MFVNLAALLTTNEWYYNRFCFFKLVGCLMPVRLLKRHLLLKYLESFQSKPISITNA